MVKVYSMFKCTYITILIDKKKDEEEELSHDIFIKVNNLLTFKFILFILSIKMLTTSFFIG